MPRVIVVALVAAALGCGSAQSPDAATAPPAPLQPPVLAVSSATLLERLTASDAPELGPALSLRGDVLLYLAADKAHAAHPGWQLVRRSLPFATSGAIATPAPGVDVRSVSWLPDGSGYVAERHQPKGSKQELVLVKFPDGDPTVIVDGDHGHDVRRPRVSPSGTEIAFNVTPYDAHTAYPSQIGVASIDGSNVRLLGTGQDPSWSPDGVSLVFTRAGDHDDVHDLFTLRLDDPTHVTRLTTQASLFEPCWSPDGKWLVAVDRRQQWVSCQPNPEIGVCVATTSFLVRLGADGTNRVPLTATTGAVFDPTWGSDGAIYFVWGDSDYDNDIWRLWIGPEPIAPVTRP